VKQLTKPRHRTSRRGDTTITTVILVAVSLSVIISASFFAYMVLEIQSQVAEYENAKTALLSFSELIDSVSLNLGSAGFTRIYFRAGGLSMLQGTENISITVNSVWNALPSTSVNLLKVRGGRFVGGPDYMVLRGKPLAKPTDYLIVTSDTSDVPLGWVYVEQSEGSWTTMDFGRAKATFTGTFNYSETGVTWELLNVVEVLYIKPFFKTSGGGMDTVDLRARNVRMNTDTRRFSTTDVTITVNRGTNSQTVTIHGPATFNGVQVKGTVVYVTIVDVEVSIY